jgi:hypothetical protein
MRWCSEREALSPASLSCFNGAFHRVHCTHELNEQTVAGGADDIPIELNDAWVDYLGPVA